MNAHSAVHEWLLARFHAVDGTDIEAAGFSSIDVVGLAAATRAPNVQFNLGTAVSSTLPRQLLDGAAYLERLEQEGGALRKL
ncbi:hypothetical protein [Pseudomonas thivervalensis]|uniref:hypothetical protein n=1 Tax=Pseudomonas thivervalensis TaxID=86265 RepID=UPI003D6BF2DB